MQEKQDDKLDDILDLGKLNELRILLTGLNQVELERLQRLMRDPQEFAEEISEWLPYSIRKLIDRGVITVDALLPFMENAMHQSIQKNPHKLADILFPVMGPAIRKAVSEDMKKLIASVNTTLESGLSPQSLKWRMQAMFSRRTFAEFVMANTYIYHVRQVFFIHRETGILLHQEVADENIELESDMVSGMLTAIRDFVQDSFKSSSSDSLDEIQVGELKIIIEQGPYAIVAAIVEGQPPADYRLILMETVEALHFNHALDLEKFSGDTEVFAHTGKFLRNCLVKQKKEKEQKPPWPLLIVLSVLVVISAVFIFLNYDRKSRFNDFAEDLDALSGFHLTKVEKHYKTLIIYGLRDMQAADYGDLLAKYSLDSAQVVLKLEPYISLEEKLVIKRAEKVLQPPSSATFSYAKGVLYVSGEASEAWIAQAIENAYKVVGVSETNVTAMNPVAQTQQPDLQVIIKTIGKYNFSFDMNIVALNSVQQLQFDSIIKAAIHLADYNRQYAKKMKIYVKTYTNRTGNATANLEVATRRADAFVTMLQKGGVAGDLLESQVLFLEDLDEAKMLRSVSFEVVDTNQN